MILLHCLPYQTYKIIWNNSLRECLFQKNVRFWQFLVLNNYNKLTNQMTVILQVLIYWPNACSLPQWKSSSNCRRPCSIVRTSATSVRNVCSLHVLPVLPVSGSALPVTATRSVNKGSSSQCLLSSPIVSNMFIYIIKYCFN